MRRLTALVLAVLVLAGCTTELPPVVADPPPASPPPALTVAQAERVVADFSRVLGVSDGAPSSEGLEERMTGPALGLRLTEYALRRSGLTEDVTTIPERMQTFAVPATTQWPRTFMAVTEQPPDLQPPLLLAFTQEDPRAAYRLWAWVRLFPGISTPALAQPEVGSAEVAPTDLVLRPAEVLLAYLDLLGNGDASEHAGLFLPDPLRDGITATRAAYTELVGENGTLVETYNPVGEGLRMIGTYDGGAIVFGGLETVTTITLTDSTLTLGGDVAAMLGRDTVETSLAFTWQSVVAFHVPAAGSDQPIQVLGAEHTLASVTGE